MCLIVIQPEKYHFSDEEISDFWGHSPDGFGFMYHDGENVRGWKCVSSLSGVLKVYRKFAAGKAGVLHFRMATHGEVSLDMAHPFSVSKHLLMVHNGIISGYGRGSESDTAHFVREELVPLFGDGKKGADRLQYEEEQEYVTEMVGLSNSLVFMDYEGRITQIGRQGLMHDGCWYSNTYAWSAPVDAVEW